MLFYAGKAHSYGKRFTKAVKSAGEEAMKSASERVSQSRWNPFAGNEKTQVQTERHEQNEPLTTSVKSRPIQTSAKAEKKHLLQTFKTKLGALQKQFAAGLTGSEDCTESAAEVAKELLQTAPNLLQGHSSGHFLNDQIERARHHLETPQNMSDHDANDIMTAPLERAMEQLKSDMDTQATQARDTLAALEEVKEKKHHSNPRFAPLDNEVEFMQLQAQAGLEEQQAMLQLQREAEDTLNRAEELRQLEQDIRDLNDIFNSMSQIVHGQSEQFDTIASMIETAALNVETGENKLNTCVKVDKRNHKLAAAVAASLTVLGIVALALIILI